MDAKLWLLPDVRFAYNRGFDASVQRWLLDLVERRGDKIMGLWNEHFSIRG